MKVGAVIKHRGYDISRPLEDDFVVEVGHDTLKDAKAWIDRLISKDELDDVDSQIPGETE